jgi:hypothetical protein
MNGNATRFVRFGAGFLGLVTLGWVLTGQAAKPAVQGVPTDWTHQHVIFSQPSTAEQADLVERDPRYWQQWYRRNVARVLSVNPLVPAADASMEFAGARPALNRQTHQDWSVNMGAGATVGAGNFAAKYSFSTSVANCASAAKPDFVVFSTGLQSAAGTASIVAYDNLYSGCLGIAPTTYWAYNTTTSAPGTIKTSPIISLDGSQIAFVQTDGLGHGYLVLLKWKASNGTLAAPVKPTLINVLANYPTCTAPCMAAFALRASAGVGVQHDDTTSSVFYDYSGDNLWVGDSLGLLHKFHPVFVGPAAPAEVGSPWPVTVNVANPLPLSSPVYDHISGNIFVGDGGGFLESVNATTGVSVVSAKLDFGTGIVSGPVIDISAEKVYAFASSDGTTGCGAGTPCAAVYEFSATGGLATSTKVTVGVSSATPNPLYFGAFDSAYLSSHNATGNIYVCGNTGANPILYRIPINAGTLPVAGTALTNVTTAASTAACSPVTDIANANLAIGSTENLFLSPQLNGRPNACGARGCLISFANTPWQPSPATFKLGEEILTSKLHLETVVVAGTAGATAPTWTTTAGVTVTDGSVTWMDQGALSAGAFATWAGNHPYALHNRIVDSNGYVEIVTGITGAGTSGGAAPTWPTTAGVTTTDNLVTWTNVGFLPTTALQARGGTSGVIMDNTVGSGGASQVYYSILGSQACGTGGTGGCAVQTSQ